ncbi:zf-CGNR multi-domain protein [Labedella populi]|uniref:Zf-CGNR multi-domain protein n=1 Tax=Labedella populi TaxID=2498850 RepID=A0A3S3ZQ84_9MICO|nr:CGNR zinc finger domain-containing protein [Labedella populi]RWZ64289.1 zf-CGNR multi-domain protein [Labedella populi]
MRVASRVDVPTGQWFESSDGVRWWFDSGSLALDFAYTGGLGAADGDIDIPWEFLRSTADLDHWIGERMATAPSTERDILDAHALRGAITRLALARSRDLPLTGSDVDLVNLYGATPDIPPRLEGGSRQAGRTSARAAQALATIARDAIALFDPESSGRIRECDGEDCSLVYLDTSRGGTRRWCSMSRCGNRHKVRTHRERRAASARL